MTIHEVAAWVGCRTDHALRERGAAKPVALFIAEHRSALMNAACLLGGRDASAKVERLAERLREECRLTRSARAMLDQLLALLMLEHVHDPERPEAAYFVLIDPADPVVAEICLLTDGLRDAMAEADALMAEDRPAEPAEEPTAEAA